MNILLRLKIFIIILLATVQAVAVELIFTGNINETFDDNINLSSDDPESDWITNLMLGATIRSDGKTREFNLVGNLYQSYHVGNKDSNEFYQDAALSINKSFSENNSITVSDTFEHYPSAQSFDAMFERTERETNEGYIQNEFSASLTLYITRKFFLSGVYNNSMVKNDDKTITDSVRNGGGGALGYFFNSSNIIRVGYMYSFIKYDDGAQTRGERSYAEYEKYLTKQLRGIVQGGYEYIKMTEGESLNTRWLVSLVDNVDEKNELNISYLKESTISNISNDTFDNWRITGSLSHEISNRLSTALTIFYGQGIYKVSRERDKLAGTSLGFAYFLSEFVNLTTGYTYTWHSIEQSEFTKTSCNRSQVYIGIAGEY